ncbi:SusC/RagA family TonB-linked outer membrane protein [Maribellus sediminis]|uniref:SusC/RagA family TonB-linked outer membrane protein n=1 Tax=Maribellus sediminis TaxID=2696285 RepID=UPI00142F7CFD|nr:SusC/RagA family TonB-linked outer membrane protein [Maribellus sediminis]
MKEKLKTRFRFKQAGFPRAGFGSLLLATFMLVGNLSSASNEQADGPNQFREEKALSTSSAQQNTIKVTGKVTDGQGLGLPGVNIVEKGTMKGVVTSVDGDYEIEVPENTTLIFSFIGFSTQEINVNGRTTIDIVMQEQTHGLDEVVVTAMGVVSEKKELNFAVQAINSDEITRDKQASFVDALQGRIAGVDISGTGGSPTASSQILIRGIASINPAQNNEPIFILNGMHVSGGASKAAEINPNDIENVTVLKGAAAAALYGQEAANGAIMITTKSGKAGEVIVQASSTFQIDEAYRIPEIQDMYLRGSDGVYREETFLGWGPLKPANVQTYDNVGNYLKTGVYQKYDLSVSGGTDKFTSYASASYTDHKGIVPNDYLKRTGVLFKSDYNVSDKLKFGFMADLTKRESRGPGSMGTVYSWPIDDNMADYKNPDGSMRYLWFRIDDLGNNKYNRIHNSTNPYWSRYEDSGVSESYRTLVQGTVNWNPVKNLNLTGRLGYDLTNSESQSSVTARYKLQEGEEIIASDLPSFGSFSYYDGKSSVVNAAILATYSWDINEDMSLNFLGGADLKTSKGRSTSLLGQQYIVPEFESLNNTAVIEPDVNYRSMYRTEKNVYGYYGEVKFDYRGIAHLGVTGRNDHSSTLPKENNSYFYPSVSGGLIVTELFEIKNQLISFGKIRGNWAKVGKDAPLYRLNNWYLAMPFPDGGYGINPARSSNPNLKPEFTTSWEVGLDMRLFNDKTHLDVAYYSTLVEDQIVDVRVSPASGNILQTRNEGNIKNRGIEITWGQEVINNGSFRWNMTTNFGKNKGTVEDLPDDLVEVYHYAGQVGDIRPTAYLHGSTLALSGKDYLRNDDGKIIVDENGYPKINASSSLLIGNREPKFTMGWQNNWSYKNISLSALINFRYGGDVVNGTYKYLMSNGQSAKLEDYRNRQILIDGVVEQADGTYTENTTPVIFDHQFYTNYFAPVGSNFIEDGSFVRLSNVTLSYDFAGLLKNSNIKDLVFSVTGRNLLLLTNYSGSDPSVNYTGSSGGTGTYGIDYIPVPNTRSIAFNISAKF